VTLVRAIGFHWHAVQRDLLVLGFRAADMFTPRLTAGEVISIVVAAPPLSSVRDAFNEGFSTTDHLLATLSEQQAGIVRLQGRHARPGVAAGALPASTGINGCPADVISIDEFEARRAKLVRKQRA
jgi:hypothetical protein